jgi:ABC-type glycerol-3-phosphate transport system substrate-binding protein
MVTRSTAALLRLIVVAVLVVVVGASGSVLSASTQVLTVEVWSNWDFVQTAANAFMKAHPNVQIKISAIPGEQYFTSLPRTLGTSGGADITVLEVTGTGSYQALVKQGALVDLRNMWNKMGLTRVTPAAVVKAYTQSNGARYAVNIDLTILPVVYYNKDLFAKLGIHAPTGHRVSLSQFYAITDKLKAQKYIPMTYDWSTGAHHLFQQYLLSSCGKTMYYALAASWKPRGPKVKWTNACVVSGIAAEKTLAQRGVFGGNPLIGYDIASADFIAQKAGMLLTGMWAVSQLVQQAKFHWDWFLMPPPPGGAPPQWLLYTADGFGVNAHSKNIPLAEEFLATMMTKQFQGSLLLAGRPPSRTDVAIPHGANPQLVQMVQSLTTLGSATHFIGILAPTDFQTVVESGSQQVLLGSLSPAGLATQLEQLAQKLRAQGVQG